MGTYATILKNNSFINKINCELSVPLSGNSLYNSITLEEIGTTELLKLTVQDIDPKRAQEIINKLAELAPDEISRTIKIGSIKLIDPASEAYKVSPDILKNTIIGFLSGLAASCITVILLKLLSNKIESDDDIRNKLNLPFLGAIPYLKNYDSTKRKASLITSKMPYAIIQAFNKIRLNLKYVSPYKTIKKIIVTSAVSGEGKTMATIHLAMSLSKIGKKVLIMDLNYYRNSIRQYLSLSSDQTAGVSTVLAGDDDLSDAVIECPDLGFSVLLPGYAPENPGEMIQSSAMYQLIRTLEKDYDYILFDTPPVSDCVDALSLSPLTDGILFVVRQHFTPLEKALKSKNNFEVIKANMLGCVLNAYVNNP